MTPLYEVPSDVYLNDTTITRIIEVALGVALALSVALLFGVVTHV